MVSSASRDVPENGKMALFVLLAALTLVGVLFFPRLELSNSAKIRLEDLTFAFLANLIFLRVCTGRLRFSAQALIPVAFIIYPFTISLVRALTIPGESFNFLFFWGKEFSCIVYFMTFYLLFRDQRLSAKILRALIALIPLNALCGLFFMAFNIKGYYGIPAAFLHDSASLSGQVYLGCAIFSLMILTLDLTTKRRTRWLLWAVTAVSSVSCLATMSKSSSFGLIVFLVSFYILNDMRKSPGPRALTVKTLKWICLLFIAVCATFVLVKLFELKVSGLDLRRLRNPVESTFDRYTHDLTPKITRFTCVPDLVFGMGYLSGQSSTTNIAFTSAFDSQYIRNILVLGIVGSCAWLWILAYYYRYFYTRDRRLWVFYSSVLVSYLVMGIGLESFQLSKSGAIFWITLGILTGLAETRTTQTLADSNEHSAANCSQS